MSITGAGFRTWPVVSNRFSSDFGIEHFFQGSVKVVRGVDLVKRGDHLFDERCGQLQFVVLRRGLTGNSRNIGHTAYLVAVVQLLDHQAIAVGGDGNQVFTLP